MKKLVGILVARLLIGAVTTAIAQVPSPANASSTTIPIKEETSVSKRVEARGRGDIRKLCFGKQCIEVPYETAIAYQSALLPIAVEKAYREGYGLIEIKIKTTARVTETLRCGGFLASMEKRLVITAHHCLPPYIEQLNGKGITFRGVPARYIGSISEADLALLQVEKVPNGMRGLPFKEAVVGEAVYGRSIQENVIVDTAQTKTAPNTISMIGPVSFFGTVAAKGNAGISQNLSGMGEREPFYEVIPTQYQLIRIAGETEAGFSGSPLYNEWGEVIGIVTSTGGGATYAPSSKNFPALLKLYKNQ
ncbi:MAG TPA: serine protease [Candidatus Paceibacterota bacterium]|nr:serine protease [Candidatus Paceibacterota bacterium]